MRLRLKRRALIIAAVILVLVIAVGVAVLYYIGRNRLESRAHMQATLTQKVLGTTPTFSIKQALQESIKTDYNTIAVIKTDITEQSISTSRTFYVQRQDIRTRVQSDVKTLAVKPGDKVKQGQVLATLYNDQVLALLNQALLDYSLQQAKLASLIDPTSKSASQDIEAARLRVRSAEIAVELKQIETDKLTVNSTAAGRLVAFKVNPGDYLIAGQTVAQVFDDTKLILWANVPQLDVAKVELGMTCSVGFGSGLPVTKGTVTQISVEGAAATRGGSVLPVAVEIDNSNGTYKPGLSGNVTIFIDPETIVSAGGMLQPPQRTDIKTSSAGTVGSLLVPEGSKVSVGQPVLRVANRAAELAVEQAKNDLAIARAALSKLVKPDSLTEANDIAAQQLKVEQAKFALDARQADFDSMKVIAPFAGTITRVLVRPGDRLAANATVLTVQDSSKMQVTVPVAEMYIAKVQVGQQADVNFDWMPDTTFVGRISAIDSEGQQKDKGAVFDVTIDVDKAQDLRPGMTAKVTITTEIKEGVLAIPSRIIGKSNLDLVVSVLREDKNDFWRRKIPTTVVIQTGVTDGTLTEIRCGLEYDDQVVVPETASSK